MNRLTASQIIALRRIASNNYTGDISNNTLNSLERRGLIEHTGDFYHWLTSAGVAALIDIEQNLERKALQK